MAVLTSHGCWAEAGNDAKTGPAITRLSVFNFRNYAESSLSLDRQSVVLTGQNGAGKTNLLEAVSMLTPGRGLRGAGFDELARLSGDGGWAVSAQLSLNGDTIKLGTGQQPRDGASPNGRRVRIDGEPARGVGTLGHYLQIVWLTPAMDGLFTGPASERRRFLDRLVATFDTLHRTRHNQFERAMRQRNRMLETGETSARMFEAIESQMAEVATSIAAARIEAVERLSKAISEANGREHSAFPHATLDLDGELERALAERAAVDVEDDYGRQLAMNRDRDRAAGRTLNGPHRTDLLVDHGPKAMAARFCSTGEQKALLIGLILAHAKALKEMRGGLAPLLLLDEIAAHLDRSRREALFADIEQLGAQAWLTGTDEEAFTPLRDKAQFFTVADGMITAEKSADMRPTARRTTAV